MLQEAGAVRVHASVTGKKKARASVCSCLLLPNGGPSVRPPDMPTAPALVVRHLVEQRRVCFIHERAKSPAKRIGWYYRSRAEGDNTQSEGTRERNRSCNRRFPVTEAHSQASFSKQSRTHYDRRCEGVRWLAPSRLQTATNNHNLHDERGEENYHPVFIPILPAIRGHARDQKSWPTVSKRQRRRTFGQTQLLNALLQWVLRTAK